LSLFCPQTQSPSVQKERQETQAKEKQMDPREEIRRSILRAYGIGFLMGGMFIGFVYVGIIIPMLNA